MPRKFNMKQNALTLEAECECGSVCFIVKEKYTWEGQIDDNELDLFGATSEYETFTCKTCGKVYEDCSLQINTN